MADESTTECGCSGIRSCLLCDNKGPVKNNSNKTIAKESTGNVACYEFCITCSKTNYKGEKCEHTSSIPSPFVKNDRQDDTSSLPALKGIHVIENFVNEEEERQIVLEINKTEWKMSQSGRCKQDYGPQVNFKKKKLKLGRFRGLPPFSRFLVERMWDSQLLVLSDFQPVELCNLEYNPDRGSSIDPHIDDEWLWGERLITLNLLSPSVLTFSDDNTTVEIAVPMPQRSLIIVSGAARHKWRHAIKRQDITSRRIAITLRELSQEFSKGSLNEEISFQILEMALKFQGTSVQSNLKLGQATKEEKTD